MERLTHIHYLTQSLLQRRPTGGTVDNAMKNIIIRAVIPLHNRRSAVYKRDPDDNGHLIIDAETAPVIRRIFDLALDGMGNMNIMLREEYFHVAAGFDIVAPKP